MDASRIRKKKFAFSQISGYVWTWPKRTFELKQFCNYVYLQEVKTAANKMITQYEKNIEI